jgi:hypothetical protein
LIQFDSRGAWHGDAPLSPCGASGNENALPVKLPEGRDCRIETLPVLSRDTRMHFAPKGDDALGLDDAENRRRHVNPVIIRSNLTNQIDERIPGLFTRVGMVPDKRRETA